MATVSDSHRSGSYGFDAPYAPIGMIAGGVVCVVMAALWALSAPLIAGPLWLGVYGLLLFLMAASYIYTTRHGKFRVWAKLIADLKLDGTERALDLGCGRGLVLLEVARYITSGRAVGLDLWLSQDQSGNREDTTRANARAEGVAEHVALQTGDMTRLPVGGAGFDLVTSSLAVHNIGSAAERIRAIDEAARVLRPGGRLLLADFRHTRAYAARLRELGLRQVTRRSLGWRFWYGGPPWATYLVCASKGY